MRRHNRRWSARRRPARQPGLPTTLSRDPSIPAQRALAGAVTSILRDSPATGARPRHPHFRGAALRFPPLGRDHRLLSDGDITGPCGNYGDHSLAIGLAIALQHNRGSQFPVSAPRTFFRTAANCFASALVASTFPPCCASFAKIPATCSRVSLSPKITSGIPEHVERDGDRPWQTPDLQTASSTSAPRRRSQREFPPPNFFE